MCAAISTSFVNSFIAKEASSIATFSISSVISTVLTFACEAHAGRASQLPPMQRGKREAHGTFAMSKDAAQRQLINTTLSRRRACFTADAVSLIGKKEHSCE